MISLRDKRFAEQLAEALVGFTVERVDVAPGAEYDPAKVTARKEGIRRTLEICGGIYGPYVTNIRDKAIKTKASDPKMGD